jgi:hypothetical protein
MLSISACGPSNGSNYTADVDQDSVDVATGASAKRAPTTAPERKENPVQNTSVENSSTQNFTCTDWKSSFDLVISDLGSSETGTGQVRSTARYNFPTPTNNHYFQGIPSSGYVEVKPSGYEFPNGTMLEDVEDKKMVVFAEGESIECVRP